MECQGNVGDKAAGLVLYRTQSHQVIHAIFFGFQVAVQHGAVTLQADLMRDARRLNPLVTVNLVIADNAANPFGEDLRAAARQGIDASGFQTLQRFADGNLAALGKIGDLHHGERLQMHLRVAFFQTADHLAKPIRGQFRVQATHDMEFGDCLAIAVSGARPDFLQATSCRRKDP